jgi:hypothetical protein
MLVALVLGASLCVLVFGGSVASGGQGGPGEKADCSDNAVICTEVQRPIGPGGAYTGHDEPAVLFYSTAAGSGNSMTYHLTLPTEPATPPTQDGSGGAANFELHPAFWFGMAMCDDQSAPNPGGAPGRPNIPCTKDSDSNIYNSSDPSSSKYIGNHPGTAFTELQFYPPGWVPFEFVGGISCSATQWCAALNIDSLSENENTGQVMNPACQKLVGEEYVNFAFVTTSGTPQAPPSPVNSTAATFTPDSSQDLMMNPGDHITVTLGDTTNGLQVVITDTTTGHSGSMVASAANGFGGVQWAPTGKSCTNVPYDFHPAYSTSSEDTRVPWAAHSYNIAFSDEIGHFEYCNNVANGKSLNCAQGGADDLGKSDKDDNYCFAPNLSTLVPIGGCTDSDVDFDGPSYKNDWPGTGTASHDPGPIVFSSPLTNGNAYSRIGFETDLPRIETNTNPPCQRFLSNPADPSPGTGCVNPPAGAAFYPFFSTSGTGGSCVWRLGGAGIPGATDTFGGSSASEFGTTPLALFYASANGTEYIYEDFRTIMSNPC